jgi:hypothetical protein
MEEGLFLLVPSSIRVETARAWQLVSFGFRVPGEHTASVISKKVDLRAMIRQTAMLLCPMGTPTWATNRQAGIGQGKVHRIEAVQGRSWFTL